MLRDKPTMIPVKSSTRSKIRFLRKEKLSGALETYDEVINRLLKGDK